MTETNIHPPELSRSLSRRDFLRLSWDAGWRAALLSVLSGCGLPVNITPDRTAAQPVPTRQPTNTPFQPETPTPFSTETTLPSPTDKPETSPTPVPKELEYAHFFSEGTDLRTTVGSINWTKPATMTIPAQANLYSHLFAQQDVTFTFPNPIVVSESNWYELIPKENIFNTWQDKEEKVMVFPGHPSAHPFLLMHSNTYEVTENSRVYAAEFFRKAMEIEKQGFTNPLLGQSWFYEQENPDGIVRRVEMNFVHMTELTADDFWASPFYLDENKRMMVDYHQAWKPNPENPQERIPLIPETCRGPQHLTIGTCDHGYATIATLEIVSVQEVRNPLALIIRGLRLGLSGA